MIWLLIIFLAGFVIVMAAMGPWIYRGFMESFHDGFLMLLFALILGTLFVPLSVFGLILMMFPEKELK
jgi:hypothetical protein